MGNMIGDPAQLASMIASSNPYDVSLSLAVTQGELYYMIRLGKLIFTSLLRYALILFIFSFFSFGLFYVALFPLFCIVCYKFKVFLGYLKNYNYAARYFWFWLLIWNIICQIACFYLRKWLFHILFT